MTKVPKGWFSQSKKLIRPFKNKDRYHFLNKLGHGGLANVSSFIDRYLYRVVAVKELKKKYEDNPHLTSALITEMRLLSYLDHPGIVPVYDAFVKRNGRLRYSMKLIDGVLLTSLLEKRRKVSLNQFLNIFKKICDALAYVHDRGVLHLDVKPDNILVGKYGEVMLMDWGNAMLYNLDLYYDHFKRNLEDTSLIPLDEEADNLILGTPNYMSPEQTNQQRKYLKPSSDIFSAGIILYEMLTGDQPFVGLDETADIMEQIRNLKPKPAHKVNRDIPVMLSMICQKMIEKENKNRYQNFREILGDIDEFFNSGQAFLTREFQAGDIIFHEGDKGDYSFTILSGSVEISKKVDGEKKTLAVLGKNEIVGELAIFSKMPRNATVTVLEPTIIRVMDERSVEKELEKLSPWVGKMITALSERFIGLNEKIVRMNRDQKSDIIQESDSLEIEIPDQPQRRDG